MTQIYREGECTPRLNHCMPATRYTCPDCGHTQLSTLLGCENCGGLDKRPDAVVARLYPIVCQAMTEAVPDLVSPDDSFQIFAGSAAIATSRYPILLSFEELKSRLFQRCLEQRLRDLTVRVAFGVAGSNPGMNGSSLITLAGVCPIGLVPKGQRLKFYVRRYWKRFGPGPGDYEQWDVGMDVRWELERNPVTTQSRKEKRK
jgi:hypothetical protein